MPFAYVAATSAVIGVASQASANELQAKNTQSSSELNQINSITNQSYTQYQQYSQYNQKLLQTKQEMKYITKAMGVQSQRNQQIAKADVQSLINTNYMAGLAQIQLGQQKKLAAERSTQLGSNRLLALGSAQNARAASGTIGASTKAVARDIDNKIGSALIGVQEELGVQNLNMETQIRNLYAGYIQNQKFIDTSSPDFADAIPEAPGVSPFVYSPTVEAPSYSNYFISGAAQAVGSYALRRMDLGTGSSGGFSGGTTMDSLQASFSQTSIGGSGFGSGLAYGNADLGASL